MERLQVLVQFYRAWVKDQSQDVLNHLNQILKPVTEGTGIKSVYIQDASQHRIMLKVQHNNQEWPVQVIASFLGPEVSIYGKDDGSKRVIAEAVKKLFKKPEEFLCP